MKRNWLKILVWLLIISAVPVVWAFSYSAHEHRNIKDMEITVNYNDSDTLLTEDDVKTSIADLISRRKVSDIDTRQIEIRCNNIPWVESTDAFLSVDGTLQIKIIQRRPWLRVWNNSGQSWYMDYCGFFPVREGFPVRVLQVTGNIYLDGNILKTKLSDALEEEIISKSTFYGKLMSVVKYIKNDIFLDALIEQIYVGHNLEIYLVPKVFSHTVEFGEIIDIEQKFTKLKILYKYLIDNKAINNYKCISLKYKDQAVCTKIQ